MSLEHVCIWDAKTGYRPISVAEASKLYPYTVSAYGSPFVCELCAQNVLLTGPGDKARHFRHNKAEQNKECDDRQKYFDPAYGHDLRSLVCGALPLRISLTDEGVAFELGFFYPPCTGAVCDRIIIDGDIQQHYEYSFERIGHNGTTYLRVGSVPNRVYSIVYENPNFALEKFWPKRVTGVDPQGTFFDAKTGRMIASGGKINAERELYLLQREALYGGLYPTDIEVTELRRQRANSHVWHLYRIRVKCFTESAAKFFLKRKIFLTENPTKFYPIWPAYTKDSCQIFHSAFNFYFYLNGDDAELKSYPASPNAESAEEGRLYRIRTQQREQLVSIGKSGALGFSYLIRQAMKRDALPPTVKIFDCDGVALTEDRYTKVPKLKRMTVECPYDGKAVIRRTNIITNIYRLQAEQRVTIDELALDMEIQIFQGCDCIRSISFEREMKSADTLERDTLLVKSLKNCAGPAIPVTHAMGAMVSKFDAYPKTKKWLYEVLRRGEMPRKALRILERTALDNHGGNIHA